MVGLTTPVIWPLPSTATDCFMSNSMRRPARPLFVTTLAGGKFTVTVVCVGEPVVGLNVPFSVVRAGGFAVMSTYSMTGSDIAKVALAYVSAGTVLKESGARKPNRRAKSTVLGVDSTCGEPLLPFRVIEVIVTSKPTTDASGAPSPVTKTAGD